MKHGGIVHRGTVVLPYGIKTVLGCTPWNPVKIRVAIPAADPPDNAI